MNECIHHWRGKICVKCGLSSTFYESAYYTNNILANRYASLRRAAEYALKELDAQTPEARALRMALDDTPPDRR